MSEIDPKGLKSSEPGAKLDAGKPQIIRGLLHYFPRAEIAKSNLSVYGATKYSWKGWESVEDGFHRYTEALGRHLLKEELEGPWDLDAKNDPKFPADILHATQVAWNADARLELFLRKLERDKL